MTRMVGNWTEEQCRKYVNDFKAAYPEKWNAIIAKAKDNESWDIQEWYDFCRPLHSENREKGLDYVTNLLFDVNRIIVKEAGL